MGAGPEATDVLTMAAQCWAVKEGIGASTTSELFVLGASYRLSKRTALHAPAGFDDNKALGMAPWWKTGGLGSGIVIVANDKVNGLAAEIRGAC